MWSSHLTDNVDILACDDSLLHLVFEGPANHRLVVVAVRSVNVSVTCSNGCLYCSLAQVLNKKGQGHRKVPPRDCSVYPVVSLPALCQGPLKELGASPPMVKPFS